LPKELPPLSIQNRRFADFARLAPRKCGVPTKANPREFSQPKEEAAFSHTPDLGEPRAIGGRARFGITRNGMSRFRVWAWLGSIRIVCRASGISMAIMT